MNDSDNTVGVVLTNPLVRVLGGFTVTKHVTGETAGYVADSTFTVSYSCSDGTTGTLTLTDGSTAVGERSADRHDAAALSETAKPATKDASYAWGDETWDPSNTVTIAINDSDNTVGVVLTNPLVRVLGGFDGHQAGHRSGRPATWPARRSRSPTPARTARPAAWTLTNGETKGVDALPIGTTCTLAETSKPATSGSTSPGARRCGRRRTR